MTEYRFKPLVFHEAPMTTDYGIRFLTDSGHGIVCREDSLLTYDYVYYEYQRIFGHVSYPDHVGLIRRYNYIAGRWEIINCKNLTPGKKISNSMILLSGNMIIIHGRISEDFSDSYSYSYYYQTYIGNLSHENQADGIVFENVSNIDKTSNKKSYQSIVMDGQYVYSVDRMCHCEHEMDVCRFDLITKKWQYLYESHLHPDYCIFYRCKLAYYNYSLYTFGEFTFQKISVFDLSSNEWTYQRTSPDCHSSNELYPENRSYYGFAQCVSQPNFIYICGGFSSSVGRKYYSDIWRLDLINLQWCNLTPCKLPYPRVLMSCNITSSGRLYYYNEILFSRYGDPFPSNKLHFTWLRVPKLKEICWEAMLHYFKSQMIESSGEELKNLGLPLDYYSYVVKAKTLL